MNKSALAILLLGLCIIALSVFTSFSAKEEPVVAVVEETAVPETASEPASSDATVTGTTGSSFTNAYGTATTKCAQSGCSNTIASSGDTNCCVTHSNKCLECGKYIDSDAMYCMSCIESSVTGSSFSNAYGTASTKCAHAGCNNTIASSGDTNCCTAHSNKCLECGKYIDGDAMYCMSCIESSVTGSSFSNAYGTSSTKCARSGCNNPIASSGDTNCCSAHSNKCLECGKYIDGDAMYCMSCLESSLTGSSYSGSSYSGSSYSGSSSSSSSSDPYGYGMPEAGESFTDYVQRVDPQLYSDMESFFNSLN